MTTIVDRDDNLAVLTRLHPEPHVINALVTWQVGFHYDTSYSKNASTHAGGFRALVNF